MSAPFKNQNAAKAGETATSFLYARVKPSEKRSWKKAARQAKAGGLTAWVTATLNAAAPEK